MMKYKFAIIISGWGAFIVEQLHKYVFDDWVFLGFLMVIITADTISGTVAAWRLRKFSSKGFSKIISKLLGYMSLLVSTHVLTHFNVVGAEMIPTFMYIKYAVYCTVILIEYISILENLQKMGVHIPDFIRKHLENFKNDNERLDKKA